MVDGQQHRIPEYPKVILIRDQRYKREANFESLVLRKYQVHTSIASKTCKNSYSLFPLKDFEIQITCQKHGMAWAFLAKNKNKTYIDFCQISNRGQR
jgi:hypothetical protein